MGEHVKNFIKTSLLLLILTILLFGVFGYGIYYLLIKSNIKVIYILNISLVVVSLFIILTVYMTVRTYNSKKLSSLSYYFSKFNFKIIYPMLNAIAPLIKADKEKLKLFFIELNNKVVNSKKIKVKPQNILLLTPHCIQNSNCKIKITNNVHNCLKCGNCNIKDLIELEEKYGVKFSVASGGTFARKIVSELKPKFIIAIACERDLLSGITDIKNIPVMGIVNIRPNGPCNNTKVNVESVEEAILNVIS